MAWLTSGMSFVRNAGSATLRSSFVAESGAPLASPLTSVTASVLTDSLSTVAACGETLEAA